jgi:hypothetical protein
VVTNPTAQPTSTRRLRLHTEAGFHDATLASLGPTYERAQAFLRCRWVPPTPDATRSLILSSSGRPPATPFRPLGRATILEEGITMRTATPTTSSRPATEDPEVPSVACPTCGAAARRDRPTAIVRGTAVLAMSRFRCERDVTHWWDDYEVVSRHAHPVTPDRFGVLP